MEPTARMTRNPSMNGQDWAILLFLSVLWGGSFFFIELTVGLVEPFTLVLIRALLAAAMLWLYLLVRKERFAVPPSVTVTRKDPSVMTSMESSSSSASLNRMPVTPEVARPIGRNASSVAMNRTA